MKTTFFSFKKSQKEMLEVRDTSEKKKIFQWTYQHNTAEDRINKFKTSQEKIFKLKHKKVNSEKNS